MLTLSDSAVYADARRHRAILAGPKPCGKQAAAAVLSWFFTICTLSFTHRNTHHPVAAIALSVLNGQADRNSRVAQFIE